MSTNSSERPARKRWQWIAVAATVLLIVATAVFVVVLTGDRRDQGVAPPGTPIAGSSTVSPPASTTVSASTTSTMSSPIEGYQMLYPFASVADAKQWQASYRQGGHQPWHLDAGMTALSFTQAYLGYTTIDRITSTTVAGSQAWIGVGYALPDGGTSTAATVHLVKTGTDEDSPWEAVGTRDKVLTLTQPAYGSTVTSPVAVGGRITGVDESLDVQVLAGKRIGGTSMIPAGGTNVAWQANVSFTAAEGTTLTITVSTGGHVADVELFAITGVRTGSQPQ
ncbi:hypothetical protein [Kibdelosporangium aridum]|uniref:hypothetical protein n=1 Tax=Kibdelosporangium aridum TaxID=2030 RepID=UPI000A534441